MSILNKEIQNVQNPALGSFLIWRFCCSYANGSDQNSPTPLPLIFIVLPILLHEDTREFIQSTQKRSGLRAFADKFTPSKISKRDYLLALQNRAIAMKYLSIKSINIALASDLLSIDLETGYLIPLSYTLPKRNPDSILKMAKCAEKLGEWCSELSLHEISVILKVRF